MLLAGIFTSGSTWAQVVSSPYPWDGVGGSVSQNAIHLLMAPNGSLLITAAGANRTVGSHAEPRYGTSFNQARQDYSPEAKLITPGTGGWGAFPGTVSTITVTSAALAFGTGGNATWSGTTLVLSGSAYDSNLFCSSHLLVPDRAGSFVIWR